MADVFISYSKPDRDLVLNLSTFLESEGWSVWWDKGLAPGDAYRDEIMKQLALARAVITVWTEHSVTSDWVRAEAGRAKADGKLIPTKTPALPYDRIPLPFGEMHTENINSLELVRAAVVAQLAKPSVAPSTFHIAAKHIQFRLLTWVGIIGGILTLFANLNGVLNLADWAQVLVQHWHAITSAFWKFMFELVRIHVPIALVPVFTFLAFATMLVVGINLVNSGAPANPAGTRDRLLRRNLKMPLIGIGLWVAFVVVNFWIVEAISVYAPDWYTNPIRWTFASSVWLSPLAFILYVSQHRLIVLIAWCFFTGIGVILLVPLIKMMASPADAHDWSATLALLIGVFAFQLSQFVCILLTPAVPLVRRLLFLAIGLTILLGLSELSQLNLRQYLDPKRMSHISPENRNIGERS